MLCAVNGSARRIALASDEHAIFQCCRRSPFVLVGCFNLGCASRCGNLECGGLCVKCAWRSGQRRRHRARLAMLRRARTPSAARPLARSVERFQRTGNHRAMARTRRPPATNRSSGDDVARSGARSCERTREPPWRSTSSPARPCGCNGCTCCPSLSRVAAGCMLRDARRIRAQRGSRSRRDN